MSETYKITELVGTSPVSFAEAAKSAVAEAAKTVRNMEWFEIADERGRIKDGKIEEFQVRLRIGFKIER
jgi:flavin-binding protein dodecin